MPPQYVKPHIKTNKHDAVDAEAIREAVIRLSMRFVLIKTVEQQTVASYTRPAISCSSRRSCTSTRC